MESAVGTLVTFGWKILEITGRTRLYHPCGSGVATSGQAFPADPSEVPAGGGAMVERRGRMSPSLPSQPCPAPGSAEPGFPSGSQEWLGPAWPRCPCASQLPSAFVYSGTQWGYSPSNASFVSVSCSECTAGRLWVNKLREYCQDPALGSALFFTMDTTLWK